MEIQTQKVIQVIASRKLLVHVVGVPKGDRKGKWPASRGLFSMVFEYQGKEACASWEKGKLFSKG